MFDCTVCYKELKGYNKKIVCIHCNYESCISCTKRFILDSVNDAKCMSPDCKKPFSREYLIDAFSYTFLNNEYKIHRQDIIFDRQMSMMEETQQAVEERSYIKNIKKQILDVNKKLKPLKDERKSVSRPYKINRLASLEVQLTFHKAEVVYLEVYIKSEKEIKELEEEKKQLQQDMTYSNYREVRKKNGDKYFGHCPAENCKGFITNSWKCGICETKVCKSCKEKVVPDYVADDDLTWTENKEAEKTYKEANPHECDPTTLENLKQIKQDCRPCPKCKVPIMKVSGCRQMFCTQCHVSFDWKTGELVVSGIIHNPHYFEWKRLNKNSNNINNPEQNPCDDNFQIPNSWSWNHHFGKLISEKEMTNIVRMIVHIQEVEVTRYNQNINQDKYLEYRIEYITNKITEKKFKQKLQNYEKKTEKDRDFGMIFDMFVVTMKQYLQEFEVFKTKEVPDPLRTWCNATKTIYISTPEKSAENFLDIADKLIDYTNESFIKLKEKYKNSVPQIKLTKRRPDGVTGKKGAQEPHFEILKV